MLAISLIEDKNIRNKIAQEHCKNIILSNKIDKQKFFTTK